MRKERSGLEGLLETVRLEAMANSVRAGTQGKDGVVDEDRQ